MFAAHGMLYSLFDLKQRERHGKWYGQAHDEGWLGCGPKIGHAGSVPGHIENQFVTRCLSFADFPEADTIITWNPAVISVGGLFRALQREQLKRAIRIWPTVVAGLATFAAESNNFMRMRFPAALQDRLA